MLKFDGRHAKIITWLFYLVLPPCVPCGFQKYIPHPRPCTAGRSRAWYFWTWFPWPTLTLTLSSGPLFVSLHYIFYTPSRRRYSSQTRRLQKLRRRRIWWVGRYLTTMSQKQLESECLEAFEQGNKRDAERLLPQIRQPSKVMIRVIIWSWSTVTVKVNGIAIDIHRQSSLLHLAAAHGWMDVVIDLITKWTRCTMQGTVFSHTVENMDTG